MNLSITEPEKAKKFRYSCGTHNKISHSQHAEEEVPWLMEAGVHLDVKQKRTVSQEDQNIDHTEGDGEPDVGSLQPRNANENEG